MARRARLVRSGRVNQWIGVGLPIQTISSATTLIGILNAGALALRPFTIIRTHMMIDYSSDQLSAGEFTQGALGMQVVTDSAAAAGIGSVPTPLVDVTADFFVYKPLFSAVVFASSSGVREYPGEANRFMVDSKVMRKVGLDDDIAITLEMRAFLGALVATEGRMLVKLH